MSDTATVHVKEVKLVKEGTNAKGKWTMYGLVDGNEDLFSWFNNRTLYDEAKKFEDGQAEIEYETTDKGRNLKAIKEAPKTNGDTPALGTGDYITGQKPSIEVRRIAAAVAWKNAAHLADIEMRHTVGREITPALIYDAAEKFANKIFVDLLRKGNALTDEDIPF
jgi:hypothetical protein